MVQGVSGGGAAGVQAAFEAFAREADTGLLARLRWGAFRETVLGLL